MTDEATVEKKSIINSKYAGRYKEKDWLGEFVDQNATTAVVKDKKIVEKDEEGNETTRTERVETSKRQLDLDKLFDLCRANNIDTASMEEQRDRPNAPGRIRMTLGNRLRAAARHRHGLNDVNGEWVDAPAEWLGDAPRTQNPDGSKIVVPKVAAENGAVETDSTASEVASEEPADV